MKELIKHLLSLLHISITRNQLYDARTRQILARVLTPDSVCVDIGCHKGEIMDLMLQHAPMGRKFGFEPLPPFYRQLVEKFRHHDNVEISPLALYDQNGETTFQFVVNDPAYSGIKKRRYDSSRVEISEIKVQTARLDEVLPPGLKPDLIKIDVEGAEYRVLLGAGKILKTARPLVIFEFGIGAADYYGAEPGQLFSYLTDNCELKINTLKGFLKNRPPISADKFREFFTTGREYYFIAYP